MGYGFTNRGERRVLEQYFNRGGLELTLFNDANDQTTDTSTVGDITEPSGNNYARASIEAADVSVSTNGSGEAVIDLASKFFDVTDSTMNVDSYAIIDTNNGELDHRGPIDTSDRTTDYVDLDQNDDLLLGGEPTTFGD
jgi:hypothetical protein